MLGWGLTAGGNAASRSEVLQEAALPIVDNQRCDQSMRAKVPGAGAIDALAPAWDPAEHGEYVSLQLFDAQGRPTPRQNRQYTISGGSSCGSATGSTSFRARPGADEGSRLDHAWL